MISDQLIRLEQIETVEAVDDVSHVRLGLRAPGYAGWRRRIGTYRSRGVRRLVSATRGRPAWTARLRDHRYDEVVIGADDAPAVVAAIATRLADRSTPSAGTDAAG